MSAGAKPPAGAPPPSACRRIPTASISSMKTMHWPPHLRASRFAFQARKRTMIASIPMNVCAKPEPGIETNGELKPVAIALASIVLPVPGAPTKSRPRSRLPPARSNASPDCQRVTTRRTSSFASSWPRTSASLTPHCASPGSKPRICEMPMISIGPMKIAKLAMKRKKTKTTCTQSAGVVMISPILSKMKPTVPHHVPPWKSQTIVMIDERTTASRHFLCQYQARRRPMMSSSRSCWLSAPKRLGQGIMRRKRRSAKPRKTITTPSVASSDQYHAQPLCWLNQM